MKFSCKRIDLLNAINITDRAVATKSTMYVLEGIYIEVKNDEARFIGNNLELGIDYIIPATVSQEGVTVVKASLFSDAVRKLPDNQEAVNIEVDEKGIIIMTCGFAKFDFATFKSDEYPRLPEVDNEIGLTVKESELKAMLRQTVYAVAVNEAKPVLMGIYFEIKEGILSVVGCDGYRLAIKRTPIESEELKFIVPGKTAKELLSILDEGDYEVKFIISKKYLKLQLKNCILITRLIDGEYMNYSLILKNEHSLTVKAETKKLLDSIDRASLIISESMKNYVILKLEDDTIFVNCESVIGKVKDKISVEMEGEPVEIAFNPKYLMDALKNIEGEKISVKFSTPSNPAIISPLDKDDFICVVTPVRMSS